MTVQLSLPILALIAVVFSILFALAVVFFVKANRQMRENNILRASQDGEDADMDQVPEIDGASSDPAQNVRGQIEYFERSAAKFKRFYYASVAVDLVAKGLIQYFASHEWFDAVQVTNIIHFVVLGMASVVGVQQLWGQRRVAAQTIKFWWRKYMEGRVDLDRALDMIDVALQTEAGVFASTFDEQRRTKNASPASIAESAPVADGAPKESGHD